MSEPLHRIADAVADVTESDAAAAGEEGTENAAAAAWCPFKRPEITGGRIVGAS